MKYIINNKELSEEQYINILNDLIGLAKNGMPLEVNYIPIPASIKAISPKIIKITLPCGHLHEFLYRLLREWNFEMFSCNTPGCKMQISREMLQECLNKMDDSNIIDFYHSKEYYENSNPQ